jgi:CPA2 family monovalent cation:H+ antiporter-2
LAGLAYVVGLSLPIALIVGTTLAFSSTATVLALLVERNETVLHHGRIAVAILIFQDLAVIPIMTLLPLLAGNGHHMLQALGLTALKAAGAVAALFTVGHFLLRPAYGFIASSRNPEVFTAATLLLVLAVAGLTAEVGMSMALGAFLVGLMLADSPYRHQVEADIEPFRGLLLGLFFMTVGMSINLPFVSTRFGTILLLTVAVLAVKSLLLIGLSRLMRIKLSQGLQIGFLLAQTGEFAFVVFDHAMGLRLLDRKSGQILLAMTALSMVLTPLLAVAGRRMSSWRMLHEGETLMPVGCDQFKDHVIIAGFGRVGRTISRLLKSHGIDFVALDTDSDRVIASQNEGLPVYYGDAGQAAVLRSVGIANAKCVVVTLESARGIEKTIACSRMAATDIPIITRAKDRKHETVLSKLGATAIIPETVEASLQMGLVVLRSTGISSIDAENSLNTYREERYNSPLTYKPGSNEDLS